jgi:AraC-like DNA-binding protein
MRDKLFGKYFRKIIISFTTLILLCVIGLSLSVYLSVGRTVQSIQYENSQKVFDQIVRMFNVIEETVHTICLQLFSADEDVRAIMNNPNVEVDIASSITTMGRIRSNINVNPIVHSIYVFNPYTKRFYSTYKQFLYQDEGLTEALSERPSYPILTPIYHIIDSNAPVFTYLMYYKMKDGQMNGGVAVNIEAGALLDSIWLDDTQNNDESVFLLTSNALLINKGGAAENIATAVLAQIPDLYEKGKTETTGFLVETVLSQKYIVSFSFMEKPEMLLVSAQPFDGIAARIQSLRNSVLSIAVIFLIVMMVAAIMVSRMVYKPVGILVAHAGAKGPVDEILYLDEMYSQYKQRLEQYETELQSHERTLKDLWLKKLMTGDVIEPEGSILRHLAQYGLTQVSICAVCVLRVGRSAVFSKTSSPKDLALLRFAVINIAMEVFAKRFENYGLDIEDDHVVIVLSIPSSDAMTEISELAQNVGALIVEHFGTPITASISDPVTKVSSLAMAYMNAVSNSDYRFVFGVQSIITPDKVKRNIENTLLDLDFKNEEEVIDAIRRIDREKIEIALTNVMGDINQRIYHNIIISTIHLTYMIMEVSAEVCRPKALVETEQKLNDILRNIFTIETSDEFQERLMHSLEPVLSINEDIRNNAKYDALMQTVMDFVDKQIGDPALCLKQVAGMAKLSTKHLNFLFKSINGITIPEYIAEIRMKKAAYYLESTSMSIREIIKAIGIENQTYFYSLFKKKYQVSPKTYQLNYLFQQNNPQ